MITSKKMMTRHQRNRIYGALSIVSLAFGATQKAHAVPTTFLLQPSGTQADVTWGRLENERFVIYFDSSQKTLAEHALKAAEKAYPDLSLLLGTKLEGQKSPEELTPDQILTSKFEKIPIVISARSDGASFANFLSQTLEIQSTEAPPASLFQHELSHRMMYEHMDLNVGPAGRTFMLAMLPTWWTEGLPEYLTESLGRLETNGYLRAMALNDNFLSWDRLHALYKASGDTSVKGYAISGRFFKYFLERTPTGNLQELHRKLTWSQLIPPFFTGAYFLIHQLTGQWPGDLYESFQKDIKNEIITHLEGMPRLEKVPGATRVLATLGNFNFVANSNTLMAPDFSTDSRPGGLEVYKFSDSSQKTFKQSSLLPLSIQPDNRVTIHPAEWKNGGFWTTSSVTANNRTQGHSVFYYPFQGAFDSLKNSNLKEKIKFDFGDPNQPPIVRRIVTTSPSTAAVLTTRDTESKLYIVNARNRDQTILGEWRAPDALTLIRHHHAESESDSTQCAYVVVNHDEERTSVQRACRGQKPEIIIPAGELTIRDAIVVGRDHFILLAGWNDIQALVDWRRERTEVVAGLPDWVTSFEPAQQAEEFFLRVFTGDNTELWKVSLKDLKNAHLNWIISRPQTSKWWNPPKYIPYSPPFARYANAIRESFKRKTSENPESTTTTTTTATDTSANAMTDVQVPAAYRYRHWMTYPNALPPFIAGMWTFGFFSRPIVDEMERFYVQLFGSYYSDTSISTSDRFALEANLVGNRLFDGWKANVFMRPRFNGLGYYTLGNSPTLYVSQLYLRETGADVQLNRRILALNASSDVHARLYSISPSSRSSGLDSPLFGAQDAILTSAGGSLSFQTWNKVLFDKPVTDLSKRDINLGGNIRVGFDTTQSLGPTKAGDGTIVDSVSFQNYSLELTNSASYRSQSLTLRNTYSSTGGGSPLNAKEYFRPFKTYIIGANDGLQDISVALAGNGLLDYSLTGRAQYRNSLSYAFPVVRDLDTRLAIAYLEQIDGEIVMSRGGASSTFDLSKTRSVTTLTGSLRLQIDIKGYQFNPAILYGRAIDKPLWQLFTQIKFDQFW